MAFGPILHDFLFCNWVDARGMIAEELSQMRTELNSQVGTVLESVSRGAIMVGNSVPQWTALPIGPTATVLRSNGTDPSWSKVVLSTDVTGTLGVTHGGTGLTTFATGDLIYASATDVLSRLAAGTAGYVLTSRGAGVAPVWQQLPSTPVFFPEEGGDESMMVAPSIGVGTSGDGLGWSVLTNGDPVSPALVFDSNGDVIMTRPPL